MSLSDRVVDHLRAVADEPDLSPTKYRLIRAIGRGGMGSVWLVEDRDLGRQVAMKVLDLPDAGGELSARLLAEARLLASLEHPNIIPVHDAGVLPDRRVFYVMKLVRGKRLDEWTHEGPSRPARLRLFGKICEAVAFAHAHGVIHRDLKPANVMVGPFGEALVMDWGIARAAGTAQLSSAVAVEASGTDACSIALPSPAARSDSEDSPRPPSSPDHEARDESVRPSTSAGGPMRGKSRHVLTPAAGVSRPGSPIPPAPGPDARFEEGPSTRTVDGTILGTPGWMAPEQARGELSTLDERADIWSLGALLYFLLSVRAPHADSPARGRAHPLEGAPSPPPLRRLDRSIPKALEAICAKAMASAPAERYAAALDLAQDIERFLGAEPVSAHREGLLEKAGRLASRNAPLLWLIAAYLLMRVLVELFRR